MDDSFGISEAIGDRAAVITVDGEIDIATAPRLREQLHASLTRGTEVVVVDLLGVTFIDSTALGALIGGLRACRESGISLRLVIADPRILKVFEITGLDTVFSVMPTLEDAIR